MAEISGDNVTLENITPNDLKLIIEWSTKTKDSFFLFNSILPVNGEDLLLELNDPTRQLFIIRDNQEKSLGLIKAFNINNITRRALLTFTILPSNNNTKLMQESCELLLERLFKKQNITKVYSHCLPYENEYKKVLTKLLFKKEGAHKEHLYMNDTYFDMEIFGLTKETYYK